MCQFYYDLCPFCYVLVLKNMLGLITVIMFECCLSPQGSFDDFTESSAMLLFALKRRRFYMSESDQEFSSTAGLMLDGEEPPSTTFCIPQSSTGGVKLSFAGDVIGELQQ